MMFKIMGRSETSVYRTGNRFKSKITADLYLNIFNLWLFKVPWWICPSTDIEWDIELFPDKQGHVIKSNY